MREVIEGVPVTIDGEAMAAKVTVETEVIELPPSLLPEPDPDWSWTDPAGHLHRRDEQLRVPTVEWVVDDTWWCDDCRDEHEDGHWACTVCGTPVVPGSRPPSPFPTRIPGAETMTFEVPTFIERRQTVTLEWDGGRYEAQAFSNTLSSDMPPSTTLVVAGRLPVG